MSLRSPSVRGGYSADAELMFHSWKSDILANINNRELDNKAAIQLIKEQTLDNAASRGGVPAQPLWQQYHISRSFTTFGHRLLGR